MMSADRASLFRQGAALALLAFAAMGGALASGWVQDDAPLIERNARVHEASGLWSGFTEAYWPPPSQGGLYRPLARTAHTALWLIGGGARLPFVLADLALYLGAVLAVWALARTWWSGAPAFVAAALFAVHPVHVEVVATAVNQGESVVAIAAALSALLWIRRRNGAISALPATAAIAALYLVALGFKEHALVLPLLLVTIELCFPVAYEGPARARWRDLGILGLIGAGWWSVRAVVLGGLAGAAPVEGLRNEGVLHRALTMLGVAGEWLRLLVWPAHLQGDYSPWEIAPYSRWAGEQTIGLVVVCLALVAFVVAWRHSRPIAFALAWTAIALAPVSNLVIPTGILLAERTLFLASIGVVLLAAPAGAGDLWKARRGKLPAAVILAVIVLLAAGRSGARMPIYRDRDTYLAALRQDAPKSWRVMVGAGIAEMERGDRAEGERLLAAAHTAWPASPRPLQLLAFYHRLGGRCEAAIPFLEESLRLDPTDTWTRLPYVSCLLDLGRYPEARAAAELGAGEDENGVALRRAAAVADSALAAGAPPHTVRLPPIRGGLTLVGSAP